MTVALLPSCAVPIKNEEICLDLGSAGAHCHDFLTADSRDIPAAQWNKIRFGKACMSTDSFGDYKQELETLCSRTPCSYDTQKAVAMAVQAISDIMNAKPR